MSTQRLLAENTSFAAWWFLARAYHSLANRLSRFFEEQGITGAQFGVLRSLADAEDHALMLSDLSRQLMVTCGNITGVVDRLEQAGYLRRERRLDDRRVVVAQLTDEGFAVFSRVMPLYEALVVSLLQSLPLEDREVLGRLCSDLHFALEPDRLPTPDDAPSTAVAERT
jgi:DNA-binding MarR family transcriptional regulator